MNIFTTILNKIFPHDHPATTTSGATTPPASGTPAGSTAGSSSAPAAPSQSSLDNEPARTPTTPLPEVDVEAILSAKQKESSQALNWRTSIVDLIKLLGLDSSLEARKELAKELNYTGDTEDSASMNVWLHRAVMQKLAENGGRVPDNLK